MGKTNEQIAALASRLDAATNEIANDLKALREQVADTIAPETLASLDAGIARLEAMGQDAENPVPEPAPEGGTTGSGTEG